MTLRERLTSWVRRLRLSRYEQRRVTDELRKERADAHVRRQREGIHDVHPGAAGG
jgi:hypothetical protein